MGTIFTIWDTVLSHQNTIIVLGSILGGLAIIAATLRHLWRSVVVGSRLVFEPDLGPTDETFHVRVANIGKQTVSNIQFEWIPRSSMTMEPSTQSRYLRPGDTLRLTFTIDPMVVIYQKVHMGGRPSPRTDALGYLVLTYRRLLGRSRAGFSIMPNRHLASRPLASAIELGPLPHKSLRESAIVRWLDLRLGFKERRERRLRQQWEREDAAELARAWRALGRHGIEPRADESARIVEDRLLDELSLLGWTWEWSQHSDRYRVTLSKTWPPSTSSKIIREGRTLEEAVVKALASALDDEEEYAPSRFRKHD